MRGWSECRSYAVMLCFNWCYSGDVIISQGDDGDYFYVIGSGNYDIFINTENGQKKKVNSFNGEGSFGELALMYSQPRSATVKGTFGFNKGCFVLDIVQIVNCRFIPVIVHLVNELKLSIPP